MQLATSGVDAIRPKARRTPVPELPKSSGASGLMRPDTPTPRMRQVPSASRVAEAPSAFIAFAVLRTSSPSSRPFTTVSPMATAPNISARCDMDLSPGTRMVPVRPEALRDCRGEAGAMLKGNSNGWMVESGGVLTGASAAVTLGFDGRVHHATLERAQLAQKNPG